MVTKDVSCEVKQDNFSQTFVELAHMIMSEKNFRIPSNLSQAEHLYIDLGFIEDMYWNWPYSFTNKDCPSLATYSPVPLCYIFTVLDLLKNVNSLIASILLW